MTDNLETLVMSPTAASKEATSVGGDNSMIGVGFSAQPEVLVLVLKGAMCTDVSQRTLGCV